MNALVQVHLSVAHFALPSTVIALNTSFHSTTFVILTCLPFPLNEVQ